MSLTHSFIHSVTHTHFLLIPLIHLITHSFIHPLIPPLVAVPCESVFQAIVSVIAVNIQFSSPSGVFLSLSLPGILYHQI